jgi:hypothetical protein
MVEALWIMLAVIALAMAALLAYWLVTQYLPTMGDNQKIPDRDVVKHDWLPTGRIDFATRLSATEQNKDQRDEFKLLVEERRIVESIAGNENLEIQWRLATLSEAKTVVTQYHTYLSENSLIKSIPELSASSRPSQGHSPAQQQISIIPSSNGGSDLISHPA